MYVLAPWLSMAGYGKSLAANLNKLILAITFSFTKDITPDENLNLQKIAYNAQFFGLLH